MAIERPILFSEPMIRAIMKDQKTQTRRVIKPQPDHCHQFGNGPLLPQIGDKQIMCPYGKAGDQLWVRETFCACRNQGRAICLGEYRMYGTGEDDFPALSARESFKSLWKMINDKRPGCEWDTNPLVWVINFTKQQ